jgi:hypothetical protein
VLLGLSAALAIQEDCRGGVIAADSASDPAYADWLAGPQWGGGGGDGMDNGGFVFLALDFEADEGFWEARCTLPMPNRISSTPSPPGSTTTERLRSP